MSANLVLIASYPKSGNTWARIVFEKLRRGPDYPINSLEGEFHVMPQRQLFDKFAPVNAADLLPIEIDSFFPEIYRQLSAEVTKTVFVKVHERLHRVKEGDWVIPPECVLSAIYLVRHPYDVAVSNAYHYGVSPGEAVEIMANDEIGIGRLARLPEKIPQDYGSWSGNIVSWLDNAPYRVTLVRYEDLLADPISQFERLADAAGLANAPYSVAEVVKASSFERLQNEERQHGFRERPKTSSQFFRAGRAKSWESVLDDDLRDRLVRDHGAVMERLGYTADGETREMPR